MKFERVTLAPQRILGFHAVVPGVSLSEYCHPTLAAVASEMNDHGVDMLGPPTAVFHGATTDTVEVTVGFRVAALATPRAASVITDLPGGPAVVAVHTGGYDTIGETHRRLMDWISQQHLAAAPVTWEEYVVGPTQSPDPAAWQTRLVYPLV